MTYDHWKTTNPEDRSYCDCGRPSADCVQGGAQHCPALDEEECGLCGGEGVYDGECECGDDTCCCLTPTPIICPQCGGR
jgi:hypothetical protein